ncbi:hypothetical protein ACIRPS_32320 [Streptomyces griseoviridis]
MRRDSVDVNGRTRTYTVAGPADGKPSRDLVLVFHGSKPGRSQDKLERRAQEQFVPGTQGSGIADR